MLTDPHTIVSGKDTSRSLPQSLWSRCSITCPFTETDALPAGRIHKRLRWKMTSTAPKICRPWPGIRICEECRHSINGKHFVTWEVAVSQSKKFRNRNIKLICYLLYFKTLIVADSSQYLLASNGKISNKYHIPSSIKRLSTDIHLIQFIPQREYSLCPL
jgi:hypothetical protein